MPSNPTHLVLFDIDGTLLWPDGAGREAMRRALLRVLGQTGPIDSLPMAGKTDPQIIRELLRAVGLEANAIEATLLSIFSTMTEILPETLAEAQVQVCPGVPALLEAVGAHRQILSGLLTGNLSATAPLKLRAAGIDPALFKIGAFGSDDADRLRLPGVAAGRAKALTGLTFEGEQVVIIGDTPADVACARPWGARAIAVATGPYSQADLRAAGADVVLADLSQTTEVIKAIL
ncbi:MAG: HAD family hydrolase [Anaerolineae bacterium]